MMVEKGIPDGKVQSRCLVSGEELVVVLGNLGVRRPLKGLIAERTEALGVRVL